MSCSTSKRAKAGRANVKEAFVKMVDSDPIVMDDTAVKAVMLALIFIVVIMKYMDIYAIRKPTFAAPESTIHIMWRTGDFHECWLLLWQTLVQATSSTGCQLAARQKDDIKADER
jgi:uncharacterized MAPEG superfamily protein